VRPQGFTCGQYPLRRPSTGRTLMEDVVGNKAGPKTSSKRQWALLLDCLPVLRSYVRRVTINHEAATARSRTPGGSWPGAAA
jgi:hypothetical protein